MAHILIADDDEIIHELFGMAFRDAGHTVGCVADGIQALAVMAQRRFDLLVLDCNMPQMGGTEVLLQMRSNADWAMMPVIVLTGHASPQDRSIAENARADLFCSKACDPDWLVFQAETLMAQKGRAAPVKHRTSLLGKPYLAC